jgi:hypothetical protein
MPGSVHIDALHGSGFDAPTGKYLKDNKTFGTPSSGGEAGWMELDEYDDIQPSETGTGTEVFELDSNGDLQPQA